MLATMVLLNMHVLDQVSPHAQFAGAHLHMHRAHVAHVVHDT